MHLSRLTVGEMLPLSQSYLDPNHPAHQALAGMPEVASLMPRLSEVHQVLLASQSQDDLRASSLQQQVTALDAEHDELVHGLECLFQALTLLAAEDEVRRRWQRLHQLLLPEGRKITHLSYELEASNAALLEQILDGMPDADRQLLNGQMISGRSVMTIIENLTATGKQLGQKDEERRALPITPTDDALQSARNQWMRIVGAIVAMLQMAELLKELPNGVKQHVLGPLRVATERVNPRPAAPGPTASQTPVPRTDAAPPRSEDVPTGV